MAAAKPRNTFIPSGFFVLRTPLLPFDALTAWSEGLEAPGALGDPLHLEHALAADRMRLRARLESLVARPEIREALFVASPHLDAAIETWKQSPESERGQRVERALVRYFARMAGRATPFGLFAGISIGALGESTQLRLEPLAIYQRHTRLDMDYLFALTETLGRDTDLQQLFVYRPNSSLYRAAGRLRYVEARLHGNHRSYHLVAVEDTDYLQATLARAHDGASLATLARALVDNEVSLVEAEAYVQELIASQLLVPEIALPVTGSEPLHPLVAQLQAYPQTRQVAAQLDQMRTALSVVDATGLGVAPDRYRALARLLDGLPTRVDLPRLFQVDMVKPTPQASLGGAPFAEIMHGIELLQRLAPASEAPELQRFREAFVARYEGREVPLVEALDEEVGIGFDTSADTPPVLKGLQLPGVAARDGVPWGVREALLLHKLSDALQQGAYEIALKPSDLESLCVDEPLPLPEAFMVWATVVAASEAALARGDFRVLVDGAFGPSGARLLGRFCHADEHLSRCVAQHVRTEAACHPEAVYAEIVHLPEGRLGNIVCRPVLREYEIPFLGQSGAPRAQQIALTDLRVSVQGGRVVLRSARLGCEVKPRLTTAHYFKLNSLGVYKFLGTLQHQGVASGASWDWGPLRYAPFLPRVTLGRLVLSRACWHVAHEELHRLGAVYGVARFEAVQTWRVARRLPRWIMLADEDNMLPIDLDNVLSVESFVHLVKQRSVAKLVEVFPGPDMLCAHGPEGRFVHELIIPFVRQRAVPGQRAGSHGASHTRPLHVPRTFPPGSAWLYAKLYTGTATADQVLRQVLVPVTRHALATGAASHWFFIRYADPDWHLRLRVHGVPETLHREVLPALQAAAAPFLEDGQLWRVQLDTYEREIERYGGAAGIVLAEQLFHADSEAVLALVDRLEGDAAAEARWRLTLRGIDLLLTDLGFGLDAKCALLTQARDAFARELRTDGLLRRQLGEKFQQERQSLETLLDPARDEASPLLPGLLVLRRRSSHLAPIVAALQAHTRAGQLSVSLAELAVSYIHMHANRLLRSAHRAQELVLYDFLARLYQSQLARQRGQLSMSSRD